MDLGRLSEILEQLFSGFVFLRTSPQYPLVLVPIQVQSHSGLGRWQVHNQGDGDRRRDAVKRVVEISNTAKLSSRFTNISLHSTQLHPLEHLAAQSIWTTTYFHTFMRYLEQAVCDNRFRLHCRHTQVRGISGGTSHGKSGTDRWPYSPKFVFCGSVHGLRSEECHRILASMTADSNSSLWSPSVCSSDCPTGSRR